MINEDFDTNSDEDVERPSKKSRLGPCEVCTINESKYCCPKCEVKTCCLQCLNIHKKELNCTGIRDKTKFMPIKEMTESDFYSDYTFLEDCTRYISDRKRDKIKRFTRFNKNLPTSLFRLRAAAKQRNICLKFLLQLFTKHKVNTTFYDFGKKIIYWHCEWYFPNAENARFVDERCCENLRMDQLLAKYFNANEMPTTKCLEFYQSLGLGKVECLLKSEGIKRCKNRYYALDMNKTLMENLAGKTIVEYPRIYIVYKTNKCEFDIIDSDEDVETETNLHRKRYDRKLEINEQTDKPTDADNEKVQTELKEQALKKMRELKQHRREERDKNPQNFLFSCDNENDYLSSTDSEADEKPQQSKT